MSNQTTQTDMPVIVGTFSRIYYELEREEVLNECIAGKQEIGISSISSTFDDKGNLRINVSYEPDSYNCCVCYDDIVGPILSCENYHSLCQHCNIKIENNGDIRCPICRSETKSRNFLMEHAIKSIVNKCPFYINGCRNESFPVHSENHALSCKYADIKCLWCGENTTTFDLPIHTEFSCRYKFYGMSCPRRIDAIKSNAIENVYIVSQKEESRILYVEKSDGMCNMVCVQAAESEDPSLSILLSYTNIKTSQNTSIKIPIHRPKDLIEGKVDMFNISLDELNDQCDIIITGFSYNFRKDEQWMVQSLQGYWFRSTVIRSMFNMVLFNFNEHPIDGYQEWINLNMGESERIKSLDTNVVDAGLDGLDDDQILRIIMDRSMNE
jgi:hypothetical protein